MALARTLFRVLQAASRRHASGPPQDPTNRTSRDVVGKKVDRMGTVPTFNRLAEQAGWSDPWTATHARQLLPAFACWGL